jgi:hypothetical protein
MKIVKMKFETEIVIPIDTNEREKGLKTVQDKNMPLFADDDERKRAIDGIAYALGLNDGDRFSVKIINDKYEVVEI